MFIKNHHPISAILIILSLLLYFNSFTIEKNIEKKAKQQEEIILTEKIVQERDYFAILEIPKIAVKKELYKTNDERNDVNHNVYVHPLSKFPNNNHGNFILAAHSGNGKNAYFKDLYKLEINDEVKIYYQNKVYTYQIEEIEYQRKTGELYIKESNLILITCTKNNKKTQTIYYAKLKNCSNFAIKE